jgi:hypothetical protein
MHIFRTHHVAHASCVQTLDIRKFSRPKKEMKEISRRACDKGDEGDLTLGVSRLA